MKVRAIGFKTEEEVLDEVKEAGKGLWSERQFIFLRDFLLAYLAVWIAAFMYCFCQNSWRYFVKHFKLVEQGPVMALCLCTFLIWVYVAVMFGKEAGKLGRVNKLYDDGYLQLELAGQLNQITDFQYFEESSGKIKLNYLTNGKLSHIIIDREVWNFKFGVIDLKDNALIIDFDTRKIYSGA